jgi:hypothetical protein
MGANVRHELFVALHLKIAHHFFKAFARVCFKQSEDPGAFGATPVPKTLFNPHQFSTHGGNGPLF